MAIFFESFGIHHPPNNVEGDNEASRIAAVIDQAKSDFNNTAGRLESAGTIRRARVDEIVLRCPWSCTDRSSSSEVRVPPMQQAMSLDCVVSDQS